VGHAAGRYCFWGSAHVSLQIVSHHSNYLKLVRLLARSESLGISYNPASGNVLPNQGYIASRRFHLQD